MHPRLHQFRISRFLRTIGVAEAAIFLAILAASVSFAHRWEIFDQLYAFALAHEAWPLHEIFTGFIISSFVFVAWAAKRNLNYRRELGRRLEAEREARTLARRDPLTGLLNRRVLLEQIDAMAADPEDGAEISVLLIDLDRFKPVNDLYGHRAGDVVLCQIANRLDGLAHGAGAIVARLGGDEFAFAIPAGGDAAAKLARQALQEICKPIAVAGASVDVGSTIGVATQPAAALDTAELIRCADVAMFRGKRAGRGTYRVFRPDMDADMRRRAWIEAEIRAGLGRGEFVPYYHPITALGTGEIVGFECLARWRHPQQGLLVSERFIPIAEEVGLINELTFAILTQAFRDAKRWPRDLTLSVNISAIQMAYRWLPERIMQSLVAEGFPAGRLIIEVTENAVLADRQAAQQVLVSLKNAGVRIALDDFGTGYATLHMRELQVDYLKIDRSFVQNLDALENNKVVSAVIGLGQNLGLPVTAEGIETSGNAAMLTDLGCTYGQGFFYSEPVPAEAVAGLLRAESGRTAAPAG